jgi:putative alpha-1,2-mannosidase
MHTLVFHLVKHLLKGLVMVIRLLIPHAPAAHTAVRHAAVAHTAVRHAAAAHTTVANAPLLAQPARPMPATTAPWGRAASVPGTNTAAALRGFNQQSSINAGVGMDQSAAIPDVGDFSYF